MKYNKHEIMVKAWNLFRMSQKWVSKLTFAECLRRAWAAAKEAVTTAEALKHEVCKMINGERLYMRRAVIAEAGRMGWVIFGRTYHARKELKRMGFRFDGEARTWYTESYEDARGFFYA